jgi:hypothetical protein
LRKLAIVLALLPALAAEARTVTADARTTTADYWRSSRGNQYEADPVIARRLRCAALVEAVATTYFISVGIHPDAGERLRLNEVWSESPRMPIADTREREAYARAVFALYDAAEALGRGKAKYTAKNFYSWYGDDDKMEALAKIRAGLGQAALSSRAVRCFQYPQIAALAPQLAARLRQPLPGHEPTASPRIQPGWMPSRLVGYLYKPDSYRFLGCAGLAQAVAKARFGQMPPPDQPDYAAPKSAPPERAAFRKAVRETFQAGFKTLTANTPAERQSYTVTFYSAVTGGEKLLKNGVVAEAAREPALRCADIPSMGPVLRLLG